MGKPRLKKKQVVKEAKLRKVGKSEKKVIDKVKAILEKEGYSYIVVCSKLEENARGMEAAVVHGGGMEALLALGGVFTQHMQTIVTEQAVAKIKAN